MAGRDAYNPEDVRTILRVSMAANKKIFQELEREGAMVDAFERIFHKELTAERDAGRQDGITIGEKRGRAEGEKQGILKTLASLIHDGILTIRDAASRANMTEDEFMAQMAALGV